jgi:hypothetical protein
MEVMPRVLSNSACALGLLIIDCWACISCAISCGLVRMFVNLSIRQSKGGESVFFFKILCIVFGLLV